MAHGGGGMSELRVEIDRLTLDGVRPMGGDGSDLALATEEALRRLMERGGVPPGGADAELAEQLALAIYRSIPGEGRGP